MSEMNEFIHIGNMPDWCGAIRRMKDLHALHIHHGEWFYSNTCDPVVHHVMSIFTASSSIDSFTFTVSNYAALDVDIARFGIERTRLIVMKS